MDAHKINLLKGRRKWSHGDWCCIYRSKGRSRGHYPSIFFLRPLLRPLGQDPSQRQIWRCVFNLQILQSDYPGVVLFFCLHLRMSTSILTTIATINPPCRFVLPIVSQNFLRDALVTSSLTKASPRTRSVSSVPLQLTGNTVFLYTLDALPMLFAIVVYVPWWPTKYTKHDKPDDLDTDAASRILWL